MRGARPVTPLGIAAGLIGGLDAYVARCTTPASEALDTLEERTRGIAWDGGLEQEMLSGHVEGAFLRMLVAITGARRVLEIGMFTGYSALAMAEALPPGGRLVACEIDEAAALIGREAFESAGLGSVVDVHVGPAAETLSGLDGPFDLVFLDADKSGYRGYVETVLDRDLLAPDGVLVIDNTLLQGEPWATPTPSTNGAAIAEFNAWLAADPRVEQVLVPLRDGVTLARRVS